MIRLVDRETGKVLGTISDADIEIMRQALEEEGGDDKDYFIPEESLEVLAEQGLSASTQTLLRNNFKEGAIEIGWEQVVDRPAHQIYGRLLWTPSERPAAGMQVEVRERRGMFKDVLLGWGFSRTDGTFEIVCAVDEESRGEVSLRVVDKSSGVLLELPLQQPLDRYVKVGEQRLREAVVSE